MRLVRFEPFGLAREFDRMLGDIGLDTPRDWAPSIDVLDKDDAIVVRVEAPGVDADQLEITVEGELLSIAGSRRFEDEVNEAGYQRRELFQGEFTRTIVLPDGVDTESITASSKDGIVTVTVPRNPEVLPRRVTVEVAQG